MRICLYIYRLGGMISFLFIVGLVSNDEHIQ